MRNNSSPNAQLYKEISTTCQAVTIGPCSQINVYPCQVGNSPSVERPVCPAARLPSQSNSPIVRDPIGRRLFIDVFFRSLLPEQDSAILPQLRVQTATSVFCFRLSATAALFNRCLQIHFSETSTSMKPFFYCLLTGFRIICRPPVLRRQANFLSPASFTPFSGPPIFGRVRVRTLSSVPTTRNKKQTRYRLSVDNVRPFCRIIDFLSLEFLFF